MPQDGQDAPAPYTPTRLQVILLAYDENGERDPVKDQHAVIRFPQSYEDAITAIERNLGEYLPGGKADSINLFCRMLNSEKGVDEWVWAKADRAEWDIVRAELALTGKPLGIRLRNYKEATKIPFVRGPLTVPYGEMKNGTMEWTSTDPRSDRYITRPTSYLEARDSVVLTVIAAPRNFPAAYHTVTYQLLSTFEFKFCYFVSDQSKGPNTELWVNFPASAYEDDEIWRANVPEPGKILGFTLEQK